GRMQSDGPDGASYVVNPALKPEFGTPDYERMMRAEVKDLYATISGNYQEAGLDEDTARMLSDAYLGSTGIYDDYAKEIRASELGGYDESSLRDQLEALMPLFDPSSLSSGGATALQQRLLEALGGGGKDDAAMQAVLKRALSAATELNPGGANGAMGE